MNVDHFARVLVAGRIVVDPARPGDLAAVNARQDQFELTAPSANSLPITEGWN